MAEAYASGAPLLVVELEAQVARAALGDDVVEERAEAVDRGGDVAGRDLLRPGLGRSGDLVRRLVLGDDLALFTGADDRIVQHVAGLLEHARDQRVELGQRLGRILGELILERLHLALPFVSCEPWVLHASLMRGTAQLQTRRPLASHRLREGAPCWVRRARAR